MATTLLALKTFKADQLQYLANKYPDLQILTREDLTEVNLNTIEIIYGYQHTTANKALLEQLLHSPASQLKWLQTLSAGVDYLPFADLQTKHVLVSNASGVHSQSIAQNVFGYLLYFERGFKPAQAAQQDHHFGIDTSQIINLDQKKILIFGTGHVGAQIAKVAKAFNMTVLGVSHSGKPKADFDTIVPATNYRQLLPEADYIVNIMPLTKETEHFFNDDFFESLPKQPVFVNVGRGPSVDETALSKALDQGLIRAAALDVFESEPLPENSPLWDQPNILITPHISGYVQHFRDAYFQIFEPNLRHYLSNGDLIQNQVDLKSQY